MKPGQCPGVPSDRTMMHLSHFPFRRHSWIWWVLRVVILGGCFYVSTCSHMDDICLLWGVGPSSLIESLSQLCVMFSQLVFKIHSGEFTVDWARHFLSFSPTLTTEVSPQTGGLVRNSTGEECFSNANPTEKTAPLSVLSGFCPLLVWLVTSSVTISVVDVL